MRVLTTSFVALLALVAFGPANGHCPGDDNGTNPGRRKGGPEPQQYRRRLRRPPLRQ